jgi:hypothetical protein
MGYLGWPGDVNSIDFVIEAWKQTGSSNAQDQDVRELRRETYTKYVPATKGEAQRRYRVINNG